MRRKNKKSGNRIWIILGVVLAFGGVTVTVIKFSEPERTVPALPVKDYTANSKSLSGNHYKIAAEVDSLILSNPKTGRLMSVRLSEGPVAVIFPPTLSGQNLEKGQKIIALVDVDDKGLLLVKEFKKQ